MLNIRFSFNTNDQISGSRAEWVDLFLPATQISLSLALLSSSRTILFCIFLTLHLSHTFSSILCDFNGKTMILPKLLFFKKCTFLNRYF
jgi:hypothetical protein